MNIIDRDNDTISGVINGDVFIRNSGSIRFNDATINGDVRLHIADDSLEDIDFSRVTFNGNVKISYYGASGSADRITINQAKLNGFFQIYYQDYRTAVANGRRVTNLTLKDIDQQGGNTAPYIVTGAINPIMEDLTSFSAGGEDKINLYQIGGCKNPILRRCHAIKNRATGIGDGDGIILDWADRWDLTEDALVEECYSIGHRSTPGASGLNNYRALRSVIRKNHFINNNIGLKAARYDDFHAYGNELIGNDRDTHFWDGATGRGFV